MSPRAQIHNVTRIVVERTDFNKGQPFSNTNLTLFDSEGNNLFEIDLFGPFGLPIDAMLIEWLEPHHVP